MGAIWNPLGSKFGLFDPLWSWIHNLEAPNYSIGHFMVSYGPIWSLYGSRRVRYGPLWTLIGLFWIRISTCGPYIGLLH